MSTFLAPHNDDEALFGAYTLLRYRPTVIVVLYCGEERSRESAAGCHSLGVMFRQWPYLEEDPDWDAIEERISKIKGHVWAPYPEEGGHDHHNRVGEAAMRHIDSDLLTLYTTYTREGRTRGREVAPTEDWKVHKAVALNKYRSQKKRIEAHLERGWEEYYV